MDGKKRSSSDTAPETSDWIDPDDAPDLTEEWFREADLLKGETVLRRGRPPSANPKQAINIRLSADVLEKFRATGPGWQTRIDKALAEWLTEHPEKV
jgi:uncharacterized protein (DUF4415 family)